MLSIQNDVLSEISTVFSRNKNREQGFLLGSSTQLTHIDDCIYLPASKSGIHFYEPDLDAANYAIRNWGKKKVCFCGMIHSHVVNKPNLSENDIEYAKQIFKAYNLPVLWFGIGIVGISSVQFLFFSVSEIESSIAITPELFEKLY